jgi:hypothetical protein
MDRFVTDQTRGIFFQSAYPDEQKEGKACVIFEDSFFCKDYYRQHGLLNVKTPAISSTKLQSFLGKDLQKLAP